MLDEFYLTFRGAFLCKNGEKKMAKKSRYAGYYRAMLNQKKNGTFHTEVSTGQADGNEEAGGLSRLK